MTDDPDTAEGDLVWQATIAAALARQGRGMMRASLAVGIVAIAAGILLAHLDRPGPIAVYTVISMLQAALLAFGIHLGLRTGFDADLFAALAARPDTAGFDRAMTGFGLMPEAKSGRPMAARVAGVKRLLIGQGLGVGLQLAALVALVIVGGKG